MFPAALTELIQGSLNTGSFELDGGPMIMQNSLIYLDNAATTPVRPEVWQAMTTWALEDYGNPSSVHPMGQRAKKAVEGTRRELAALLNAQSREIFFTGGGTESDNWAIKGAAEACAAKGRHIITTAIEHHAVLHTCEYLQKQGFSVTYLKVDGDGWVSPEAVERAIRPDTSLISVMTANNEVGTLQPVAEIGAIARRHGVLLHTDAVQALGHIPVDVESMKIELLSASAHKLGGPKGVGLLYVRSGIGIPSFIHGGGQERGRRAGTLNVPGIVGFGKAAELARTDMEERGGHISALRDHLIDRVLTEIPDSRLTGHRTHRLPGSVSFCFSGVEGESLLVHLNRRGICASSGSACTAGSEEPSHVLLAMGIPPELARGSLRLTLSERTTRQEVDLTVDALAEILTKLRQFTKAAEEA